jgi:hypothetical protein
VSGAEELVAQSLRGSERRLLTGGHDGGDPFAGIRSACAIALHIHRPLIPAGGQDLRTAPLVGNLQYMCEHPDIGENHNAAVFRWCYRRIGELIPELVDAGLRPRVMLECSGTLLHGLRRIGAEAAGPTTSRGRAATRHVFAVDDHVPATAAIRSWPQAGGTARARQVPPQAPPAVDVLRPAGLEDQRQHGGGGRRCQDQSGAVGPTCGPKRAATSTGGGVGVPLPPAPRLRP